jgi:hypothetical protein
LRASTAGAIGFVADYVWKYALVLS